MNRILSGHATRFVQPCGRASGGADGVGGVAAGDVDVHRQVGAVDHAHVVEVHGPGLGRAERELGERGGGRAAPGALEAARAVAGLAVPVPGGVEGTAGTAPEPPDPATRHLDRDPLPGGELPAGGGEGVLGAAEGGDPDGPALVVDEGDDPGVGGAAPVGDARRTPTPGRGRGGAPTLPDSGPLLLGLRLAGRGRGGTGRDGGSGGGTEGRTTVGDTSGTPAVRTESTSAAAPKSEGHTSATTATPAATTPAPAHQPRPPRVRFARCRVLAIAVPSTTRRYGGPDGPPVSETARTPTPTTRTGTPVSVGQVARFVRALSSAAVGREPATTLLVVRRWWRRDTTVRAAARAVMEAPAQAVAA